MLILDRSAADAVAGRDRELAAREEARRLAGKGGQGGLRKGVRAAVILGETILPTRSILVKLVACILGSILYRLAIALALNSGALGLQASDLNLVTAVLVGIALILPGARNPLKSMLRRKPAADDTQTGAAS